MTHFEGPLQAPIFILGPHKSGTSLLRSLLDGHPSLTVLPREPHFFERGGYWVRYPARKTSPRDLDAQEFGNCVTRALEHENRNPHAFSDSPSFAGYPAEEFLTRWSRLPQHLTETAPQRYSSYVRLLSELAGTPVLSSSRMVDKSTEYTEFAPLLQRMFTGAQFIYVLRNPYANLVSYRLYRQRVTGHFPVLAPLARALQFTYYHMLRNVDLLDQMLVLRYERLVAEPEPTMRTVAEFLRIPFDPNLLRPTSGGSPWESNTSTGEATHGIDADAATRWQSRITSVEVSVLNRAVGHVMKPLGYALVSPPKGRNWIPAHGESPRTWLANRVLLSLLLS